MLAPLTIPAAPAVLVIKDDDFGFEDDVLGVAEVDLAEAECIQNPRKPVTMAIKLMPGDSLGNAEDLKVRPGAWTAALMRDGPVCCHRCMEASGTCITMTAVE